MRAEYMKKVKKAAILISPLLLFAVLLIPYSWANRQFIVEWFGCGCPTVDEFGNLVESGFNANDFTFLFWSALSVCVTAISFFLSGKVFKDKVWLRILYVTGIFLLSAVITSQFCQMMLWN